ncbi:YceI family protein [Roseibium sediminis]|uniref:YceI family protein n=1 Tax=Roseibium sediminis TaxID=1775174 RepID=UPI0013755675|nr:YceI family protein [Roseibium sediminis]
MFRLLAISITATTLTLGNGPAIAAEWVVDYAKSQLEFEVVQGDSTLKGKIANWSAAIDFDSGSPENAKISATIDTGSMSTGNAQVDGMLPTPQWLDVAIFPAAEFRSKTVQALSENSYQVEGTLTLRGVQKDIVLVFDLNENGKSATAKMSTSLARLDFDIGNGVGVGYVENNISVTGYISASTK